MIEETVEIEGVRHDVEFEFYGNRKTKFHKDDYYVVSIKEQGTGRDVIDLVDDDFKDEVIHALESIRQYKLSEPND